MKIVGYLKAYCEKNQVDALVIDDTGVGGGVVDRLKEVGLSRTRIVAFTAGEKARNETYFFNRVAEIWWAMRNRYLSGDLDTDNDPALIGQVSSRTYEHESNERIRLQRKREMRRSPDEADALAMTFAVAREGVKIWV